MKKVFFLILLLLYGTVFSEENTRTEYVLEKGIDIPLTISAGIIALLGSYRLSEMEPKNENYKTSDLFIWDRPFAGVWNSKADKISDALTVLGFAPLAIGAVSYFKNDIKGSELGALSLMFVQSMAFQSGLNLIVRSSQLWPRPFLLGDKGGDDRLKGQAYGSFYSGHASAAFSVAVFTSYWFQNTYSSSKYTPYIWASSLTLATTVSVLRVAAGKHYPTDVIVGALMGSLVSFSILKIHEHQSPSLSIQVGPNYVGVTRHF
jgi:membrane-associated phospholipid phosphatase